MGGVQLDSVKAGSLGVTCRFRELCCDTAQFIGSQRPASGNTHTVNTRGTDGDHPVTVGTFATLMPQLRGYHRALSVHRVGDGPPAVEHLGTGQRRDAERPARGRVGQPHPLGDDQADATGCATRVVRRHVGAWHTVG